ncbi:DNA-processing protein DprA [Cupriavidus sp. WKF15]|uniref:DNA-processing protein DprA n=1 Tax=Cupriavidus sp. WKF15 TaxID=3032282 RepID=UPI0023E2EB74|nr:DNA-processing protein DprA [Cupriavidus sp. WKF15]WER45969.1 DNA-processing protein DprA [Cupriavidus sp. WKF15]
MARDADDTLAWLRLASAPGIGPVTVRLLLAAFGLPQQVFAQSVEALSSVVPRKLAAAILAAPGATLSQALAKTMAWLGQPGNHLLTLVDPRYPVRLLDLSDPPPLLYIKGDLATLARPALAIVGARGATAQGKADAEAFGRAFSQAGQTVVSGLALGVDAAAHEGGLGGAGGTIAVIGTGADRVYPARHLELAHRIVEHGAIVSEFPLGMQGFKDNFPRRNRLIAALARGVLVVEAAARSGSLITARLAADLGREVFAIPGSIHAPLSGGCHFLIRQGAKLVESPEDVMEEFGLSVRPGKVTDSAQTTSKAPQDPLLAILTHDPVTLDTLCERSGLAPEALATRLLELELEGRAERLPGNLFRSLS